MKYRDYFSLKTLHTFGIEPDRTLETEGSPEKVKENIVSSFGTSDAKQLEFLSRKTDFALADMRLTEPLPERENIEIKEALDDFIPSDDLLSAESPTLSEERKL